MLFLLDSFNFDKNYMWGMIKLGNLILRTMTLVWFNYSRYFERYGLLFRKLNVCNFEHVENWIYGILNLVSNYESSLNWLKNIIL